MTDVSEQAAANLLAALFGAQPKDPQALNTNIVIGVTGKAGSGKDTVADILVKRHGFKKIGLADPMKEICQSLFGFSEQQLWGPSAEREKPDPRWGGLTPRHALQQLGTEWGRAMHEDVWVRFALDRARLAFPRGYRGVVISDVRFENEARAIIEKGGEIWCVSRPGAATTASVHTSENGIEARKLPPGHSFFVNNDGSLKSLQTFVDSLAFRIPERIRRRQEAKTGEVHRDGSLDGFTREQLEEKLAQVQRAIEVLGPQ